MKSLLAIAFMLLSQLSFGQAAPAQGGKADRALTIELRTSATHVRLSGHMEVSVFFRAVAKTVTIWNAFGFFSDGGLFLEVFDASGGVVKRYVYEGMAAPPDLTGRGALMAIPPGEFAGFDRRVFAEFLFPGPGTFTVKCLYRPPLPRDYFKGNTIWGTEDGPIESSGVKVVVTK
jgi:hypothetical protein